MTDLVNIAIVNRAGADATVAVFESPHVPRAGELIYCSANRTSESDPFHKQAVWRVETVLWGVATPGSPWMLDYIRANNRVPNGGLMCDVSLLCWPDRGPYWDEIPTWAPRESEEDEEDDGG